MEIITDQSSTGRGRGRGTRIRRGRGRGRRFFFIFIGIGVLYGLTGEVMYKSFTDGSVYVIREFNI